MPRLYVRDASHLHYLNQSDEWVDIQRQIKDAKLRKKQQQNEESIALIKIDLRRLQRQRRILKKQIDEDYFDNPNCGEWDRDSDYKSDLTILLRE